MLKKIFQQGWSSCCRSYFEMEQDERTAGREERTAWPSSQQRILWAEGTRFLWTDGQMETLNNRFAHRLRGGRRCADSYCVKILYNLSLMLRMCSQVEQGVCVCMCVFLLVYKRSWQTAGTVYGWMCVCVCVFVWTGAYGCVCVCVCVKREKNTKIPCVNLKRLQIIEFK